MIEVNQNILNISYGIIVHQVNCQGVMGAGIALDIRKRYPIVYKAYREAYNKDYWELGKIQMINVRPGFWVCNLAGQDRYGRDKRYTDYEAVEKGLEQLKAVNTPHKYDIYIPYKMGCSNAGGDWEVVKEIIERIIPDAIICRK